MVRPSDFPVMPVRLFRFARLFRRRRLFRCFGKLGNLYGKPFRAQFFVMDRIERERIIDRPINDRRIFFYGAFILCGQFA